VGDGPPGSQNRFTRELKEELLGAADHVGEIEETPILDSDGKPTGYTTKKATGRNGLAAKAWGACKGGRH
jgi:hypothetical protein